MAKGAVIKWLKKPEDHDYPGAASYLGLLFAKAEVASTVERLRRAPMVEFKSKDIFRASGLPLLGTGNYHVEKDRARIRKRQELSPLLLVRMKDHSKVTIADGYHRLCAVYSFDEDAIIPCKIV